MPRTSDWRTQAAVYVWRTGLERKPSQSAIPHPRSGTPRAKARIAIGKSERDEVLHAPSRCTWLRGSAGVPAVRDQANLICLAFCSLAPAEEISWFHFSIRALASLL